MKCRSDTAICVLFALGAAWAFFAWLVAPDLLPNIYPSVGFHQIASLVLVVSSLAAFIYVTKIRDRLGDDLKRAVGDDYFEKDGLCFKPMVRVAQAPDGQLQAEISIYYENRYSHPCDAVVHLRPDDGAFFSHRGARDLHLAFKCHPGAFGVVHQPVGVKQEIQGQPVKVKVSAAVRWPMGRGDQLRSHTGKACGSFDVDWEQAYRVTAHELQGEIELTQPAEITLTMPNDIQSEIERCEYYNETLQEVTP